MMRSTAMPTAAGEQAGRVPVTIVDAPFISFGREVCGDLTAALRREWLVTNGLGGYASGTVAGVNTRRYHGLLVAALEPPVARTVLVGGLVEWVTVRDARFPLATHEYQDGTLDPHGYLHLQAFRLEGMLPVWVFALGDTLLERRLWMTYGSNTTYVSYRLLQSECSVELQITPLVTYRDFHNLTSGQGWQPGVETLPNGTLIQAFANAQPYRLLASNADYRPGGAWYWNFHHREETARGLDDRSDLYAPGHFIAVLDPGATCTLVFSTEEVVELDEADLDLTICRRDPLRWVPRDKQRVPGANGARAHAQEAERQHGLLQRAGAEHAAPAVQQLVLAADQFIVARQAPPGEQAGKTVIAGYHWFNDWGRDTMITLPGLTLATGRPEDAAGILRIFARYVKDGLLPNNFPDQAGQIPGYNTVDATLWYVLAIHAYDRATGDRSLVDELLPVLREIVDCHVRGTRYHIGVDPNDGLLHAGEPGVQLTWMDAKVGDWVVTPRIGKPVEINALWYNVLCILAGFLAERNDAAAGNHRAIAERVRTAFRARFVQPGHEGLADVVDGPQGDDFAQRPNQIFAASLPYRPLEGAEEAMVVRAVGHTLLTSFGLRSLSPLDPAYCGTYGGGVLQRDAAYHQGPVWGWLLGPYAEAHYRVHGDAAAALAWLEPMAQHLCDAGLGSISELFEGDPPHLPRGCIAQAWSVAETLRVWRALTSA